MKKALIILIGGLASIFYAAPGIAYELLDVDIHGFISKGYLSSDENNFSVDNEENSFVYSEMALNFGKELNDNLRFGLQLYAKDFADVGNNEIIIDWAYADYRIHEVAGIRLGQIKLPHGFYNEVRDIDMLRTTVFLPDSVYQEASYDLYVNDVYLSFQGISSRDLYLSLQGLCLYGFINLSVMGGLTYEAMYGTQNIEAKSGISDRLLDYFALVAPFMNIYDNDDFIENNDINVDYKYAGTLIWDTPLDGLRLGASLNNLKMSVASTVSKNIVADFNGIEVPMLNKGDSMRINYEKLENWVFSAEYIWNNLLLMSEYILTTKEYEIISEAFERDQLLNSSGAGEDSTSTGWYVGGSYRFTNWFELGGYYSKSKSDDDKSITNFSSNFFSELDDICAAGRFDINEFWTIKLEVHNFRSTYYAYESFSDALGKKSKRLEDEWYMYTAKMTVSF